VPRACGSPREASPRKSGDLAAARPLHLPGRMWDMKQTKERDEEKDAGDSFAAAAGIAGEIVPELKPLSTGFSVGRYGDAGVKNMGWLRNDQGGAQSVSDYGADRMTDVHDWLADKTGSDTLGHVGAVLAGLGAAPVGGAMAVGGAVANGYHTASSAVHSAADFLGMGPKVDLQAIIKSRQRLAARTGGNSPFDHWGD